MDNTLYDRTLGILGSVLEAHSAVLFLPARFEDGIPLYALAGAFSLGGKLDYSAMARPREGLVGLIIHNNEPLFISNFNQRGHILGYYTSHEETQIKAFMGCPLPEGRGALCVDTKRYYTFSDRDKRLLPLFCGLFSELYDLQRQETSQNAALRHYAALRQIHILINEYLNWVDFVPTFLDIISKASGYEYCALCVLDGKKEDAYAVVGENYPLALKRNRPGSYDINEGLAGWVLGNGRPLAVGGAGFRPETPLFSSALSMPSFSSALVLPLVAQSRIIGALCMASVLPLGIGAELQEFAGVAAGHLALFFENFQIKEELRELQKKLKPGSK
ncbi:MAG: GAF domain-containing protein [Desulfovibrionaceae bacterium]|nr:GAF domain-containing protein [Desulfovibrionaceae bacterium]